MRGKLISIISVFLFFSCGQSDSNESKKDNESLREQLLQANVVLIDNEDREIQDFIERYQWDMKETGSGLRYMIYSPGNGSKAEKDKIARIHYSIYLITGDLIYSSEKEGAKEFRIGRGGVEGGLEEGILLLREGDKARFIMPSHLAHGVPGDGAKIPKRATIIYDLELLSLK